MLAIKKTGKAHIIMLSRETIFGVTYQKVGRVWEWKFSYCNSFRYLKRDGERDFNNTAGLKIVPHLETNVAEFKLFLTNIRKNNSWKVYFKYDQGRKKE